MSDVFPRRHNFFWNVRHFQVSYSDLSQFILNITKTLNWNFKYTIPDISKTSVMQFFLQETNKYPKQCFWVLCKCIFQCKGNRPSLFSGQISGEGGIGNHQRRMTLGDQLFEGGTRLQLGTTTTSTACRSCREEEVWWGSCYWSSTIKAGSAGSKY